MSNQGITLHTGVPVPVFLATNVRNWVQHDITPGWLESLPATVAHMCAKWDITLDPIIPDSSITLVLLGHSAELGPVVIKSLPLAEEFRAEATALDLAASNYVSRLYDVDFERSVMVVERIVPGTQLLDVNPRTRMLPDWRRRRCAAFGDRYRIPPGFIRCGSGCVPCSIGRRVLS